MFWLLIKVQAPLRFKLNVKCFEFYLRKPSSKPNYTEPIESFHTIKYN